MNTDILKEKYIGQDVSTEVHGNMVMYEIRTEEIVNICTDLYSAHKLPFKMMTAIDDRKEKGAFRIVYVFGVPGEHAFLAPFIQLKDTTEFPSVSNVIHGASIYERKIKTFFGLRPMDHFDPQPIILHENWPESVFPLRKDFQWNDRVAEGNTPYTFQKVEGNGIYEIPVGPVHAGIIEPGHFRFSVAGEEIILLAPRLGYVHKGSEKLFEVLPLNQKIKLSERISGDSSFSHSMAFCQALELLSGTEVSEKANYLRVIYAELERMANHFNDIGFIMLDTGFSFGGSNGGRLREMIMQLNERLTGSRFLRGVNTIGGVTKDISEQDKNELMEDLDAIIKDFSEVIEIAERSDSLSNRLKGTGTLTLKVAQDHCVVGVAARALGLPADARKEYTYAAYEKLKFKIAQKYSGDVHARFYVRVKEVLSSAELIKEALQKLPEGALGMPSENVSFKKNAYALGVVEGWRGDILYFVAADGEGNITRVDVRDPSFPNWMALGHAGLGNVVPDFPLINKSFNLSYSGNDL